MKKLLVCILCMALIIPGQAFAINNNEAVDRAWEFAVELGIIDRTYEYSSKISRGDFAQFLFNILFCEEVEDEYESWFGDLFAEEDYNTIYTEKMSEFDDVAQSYACYEAVIKMNSMGIMQGVGNRQFQPEREITYTEAATAMVRVLGYSPMVKDNNYFATAGNLKLFKNIDAKKNESVSAQAAATIFYNCFDIDLMKADFSWGKPTYSVEEGLNLYEKFMAIYKAKGIVNENSITSIHGGNGVGKDKVGIEGKVYDISLSRYMNDYIGREVEFYYKDDADADNVVLIYGYLTNRDDAICINADEIIDFEDYVISYEKDNRTVSKSVMKNAALIYNGQYKGTYSESDFAIENGDITLIRHKGKNGYNIVIINDYNSYYVTHVNYSEKIISMKQYPNDMVKSIKMSDDVIEEYKTSYVLESGEKTNFESIKAGLIIDVIDNTDYKKIIISQKIVESFTVQSVNVEDNVELTDINGNTYVMPIELYDNLNIYKPVVNNCYTILLNSFNKIAYILSGDLKVEDNVVYIIGSFYDENSEMPGIIKILTRNNSIKRYEVADNAVIKLQDDKKIKMKSNNDYRKFHQLNYSGIASVKFDENLKINEIELPMVEKKQRDKRFGIFEKNDKAAWCGGSNNKFFQNAMLSSNSVIFNINLAEQADYDRYRVINTDLLTDGQQYNISAYNFNSDSVIASCILLEGDLNISPDRKCKDMYIVSKEYKGLDEDDNIITIIEAYKVNVNQAPELVELQFEGEKEVTAKSFNNKDLKIKKGDFIFCDFDGNGYVKDITVVYNIYDDTNKYNPVLTDTSGIYNPDICDNTNPYKFINNEVKPSGAKDFRYAQMRFFDANVYDLEENTYITYTSQPINKMKYYDIKQADSSYLTETNLLPRKFTVINVNNYYISVKDGTYEDIKTYKNAGSSCSKIFVYTRYAVLRQCVIINYSSR